MEVRSIPFYNHYPFFRYRHVPPRGEMAELFGYIHLLAVGESIQSSNAKRLSFMHVGRSGRMLAHHSFPMCNQCATCCLLSCHRAIFHAPPIFFYMLTFMACLYQFICLILSSYHTFQTRRIVSQRYKVALPNFNS
jgi:hypothetical protein